MAYEFKLTPEQVAHSTEVFHKLDRNNDGRISIADAEVALEQLGFRMTSEDVLHLANVSIECYIAALAWRKFEARARMAFMLLLNNMDDLGRIRKATVCTKLGLCSAKELRKQEKEWEKDGTTHVSLREWVLILSKIMRGRLRTETPSTMISELEPEVDVDVNSTESGLLDHESDTV